MKRVAAAVSLALLVAGCQTPAPPSTPVVSAEARSRWAQTEQRLAAVRFFDLRGRIASSGLGGGSGDLSWVQNDDHFVVQFSGALGLGALRVEGTPQDPVIITKDGRYGAEDAQAVLRRELGAPLPLDDLRYWVLGLPRPQAPATIALDEQGRLSQLDQDGWHLDYLDYRAAPIRELLPHRLWLERNGNRWKIVIDEWRRVS
jgi:outer membrane lipoprotein LolB